MGFTMAGPHYDHSVSVVEYVNNVTPHGYTAARLTGVSIPSVNFQRLVIRIRAGTKIDWAAPLSLVI